MIKLRRMQQSDKEIYFEMSREFYSSGAAHANISDGRRESFFGEILSGEFIEAYVIEYGGAVAGYALVFYFASQELGGRVAFVDELYVRPQMRGLGIGKHFLKFIETQKNVVACRLEAEKNNSRAIKLYSSLGYEFSDYAQMVKILK